MLGVYVYLPRLEPRPGRCRPTRADPFTTVRTEGALLPADLLAARRRRRRDARRPDARRLPPGRRRAAQRGDHPLLEPARRRLGGLPRGARRSSPRTTRDHDVTRERWLLPLFQELGYGRLQPARGRRDRRQDLPRLARLASTSPIHLVGCSVDLDRRTPRRRRRRRASPHGLVQELLNRSDEHLWGFVSNGLQLRLLRDNRQPDPPGLRRVRPRGDVRRRGLRRLRRCSGCVCHAVARRGRAARRDCWLERWSQGRRRSRGPAPSTSSATASRRRSPRSARASSPTRRNAALRDALRAGRARRRRTTTASCCGSSTGCCSCSSPRTATCCSTPTPTAAARERYDRLLLDRPAAPARRAPARARGTPTSTRACGSSWRRSAATTGCPALGLPALGQLPLVARGASPTSPAAQLANRDLLDADPRAGLHDRGHGAPARSTTGTSAPRSSAASTSRCSSCTRELNADAGDVRAGRRPPATSARRPAATTRRRA